MHPGTRRFRSWMTVAGGISATVWHGELVIGIPSHVQLIARRRMRMLNSIEELDELQAMSHLRLRRSMDAGGCLRCRLQVEGAWYLHFEWRRGASRFVTLLDEENY